MKNKISICCLLVSGILFLGACRQNVQQETNIRPLADTVGFAHLDRQMDSIMARIERQNPLAETFHYEGTPRVIISPHDDYSYVGSLYPAALKNIRAKTILLFGVAHKAKLMNLENQVVFDSYDYWKGPYANVKVSDIREEIIEQLPLQLFQVNDSMQRMEHSVEAVIPFLQYYNRNVQIVSILVPYMSYEKMQEIAGPLSSAIKKATIDKGLEWGKDFAIVISTDAVHYGDQDWGGRNYAPYGTDSAGYRQAIAHEKEIMDTLSGLLSPQKVNAFCDFTVDANDFHEYKWTWCGRYSVPLGLLTAFELNEITGGKPLVGSIIGYSSSIDHPAIKVDDLGMGQTAPANIHHWVGYAALGY
ncbi:MAG: AmmeMemoRadiSam system protein B [Bacteroidales bacterium]|nr:AmmeMemoRadiSam system protein B [Bacteroidales bacterium]